MNWVSLWIGAAGMLALGGCVGIEHRQAVSVPPVTQTIAAVPQIGGGPLLVRRAVGVGEVQWRQLGASGLELIVVEPGNEGTAITRVAFRSSGDRYAATPAALAARLAPGWTEVVAGAVERRPLGPVSIATGAMVLERDPGGAGDGVRILFPGDLSSPAVRLDGMQARAALDGLQAVAVSAPVTS